MALAGSCLPVSRKKGLGRCKGPLGKERPCPRCGRYTAEFIGPLCRECYIEEYGVARLPAKLSFKYCMYCGSYKYQGGWNQGLETLEDTLREYVSIALTARIRPTEYLDEAWIEKLTLMDEIRSPSGIIRLLVRIGGRSGVWVLEEERPVEVKLEPGVCPRCTARETVRGYEAIVQVRSSSGRLDDRLREELENFLSSMDPRLRESVIKVEELREGIDLLVLDHSSARLIASKIKSEFMGLTQETYKLIGRRPDGKRKGRLTILIRIPDISPGQIILVDDKPMYYLTKTRTGPLLVDLKTGKKVQMSPDELWRRGFKRYDGGPEFKKLMLLYKGEDETVFLDAESDYQRVIEFATHNVEVFVEDYVEGGEYLVFIAGKRAYVTSKIQGR